MEQRWQPDDAVILRNTGFFVGEAWATPHYVVLDSEDVVALYRPEGTPYESWRIEEQRLVPLGTTKMDMLRLMFPGCDYAVELFFDTEKGAPSYQAFRGHGRFRGWKVNIEAPFRRFELGFETTDHFLDIIVRPDRRYYWKDQEVIDWWLRRGAYKREEVQRFYAAGRELEPLIESGKSPFDDEWTDWRPEASDRLAVPKAWQLVPGVELTRGLDRAWNAWRGVR
jgi:Protein of unknown function (DUF402)